MNQNDYLKMVKEMAAKMLTDNVQWDAEIAPGIFGLEYSINLKLSAFDEDVTFTLPSARFAAHDASEYVKYEIREAVVSFAQRLFLSP